VTVARTIESKSAEARREWPIQTSPILTRTRIAVDQNDGPAGAFDYEMQASIAERYEFGEGLGMIMSNAGSDVSLFESSGYAH
jgi:hypothetical protein